MYNLFDEEKTEKTIKGKIVIDDEIFDHQVKSLYIGIQAFSPLVKEIHKRFKNGIHIDWPVVLLGTILQTTVISLFKLLPLSEPFNEPVDKRSIASLIRNLVDSHDVLDMLCNFESDEQFNLHRDILCYYLSDRSNTITSWLSENNRSEFSSKLKKQYWAKIDAAIADKGRKKRIKRGDSMFYTSRMERITKACGKQNADFVSGVLSDLSTYVHSVPPGLWMKSIDEAFSDCVAMSNVLAVWLQIANFYYANSIHAINRIFELDISEKLFSYLNRHKKVME